MAEVTKGTFLTIELFQLKMDQKSRILHMLVELSRPGAKEEIATQTAHAIFDGTRPFKDRPALEKISLRALVDIPQQNPQDSELIGMTAAYMALCGEYQTASSMVSMQHPTTAQIAQTQIHLHYLLGKYDTALLYAKELGNYVTIVPQKVTSLIVASAMSQSTSHLYPPEAIKEVLKNQPETGQTKSERLYRTNPIAALTLGLSFVNANQKELGLIYIRHAVALAGHHDEYIRYQQRSEMSDAQTIIRPPKIDTAESICKIIRTIYQVE